ncbi:trigger factor [Butyrivibrio sp. MC2021]|uniref:trigger factor n=1 Tax=Butyrivibrio sp. MC2021 TaxID=1408306 RepID=UPI00047EC82E|nr:trigger factor [Butyrivibrio sp. MC2021]
MKKKIAVILIGAVMATTIAACGKETENAGSGVETAETAETAEAPAESASTETASETTTETDGFDVAAYVDGLEEMTLSEINASDYVTLTEYDGVTVEVPAVNVTEEDVQDYINNTLTQSNPLLTQVNRPVKSGDTVNIDYVGKYADTKEAFDGGTAQGADLVIGSHSYIDGFEDGLIGAKVGETRDLNLTFPENYGAANLAGKDVVFTVTVNTISETSTELTDEWAAGLGYEDVTNLEELSAHVMKTLTEEGESNYKTELENEVIKAVTEGAEFKELPEKLLNRFMKEQVDQLDYYASMYSYMYGQQYSASNILSMMAQAQGFAGTEEEFFKQTAEDMADQYVMFKAIADEQGITITDADIDKYLKEAYESASSTAFSSFEEYKASLDLELYREGLMAEKVVEFLKEHANVVDGEAE